MRCLGYVVSPLFFLRAALIVRCVETLACTWRTYECIAPIIGVIAYLISAGNVVDNGGGGGGKLSPAVLCF